ncbi:calcium-independent phospholipase A2-gamma [Anoplophora glabripennis]|uniref:calcium-independent phospholipase A2-gamma n=1 Tax=Anoplophora glabripennis TaxID=217634 RepID=UPI000874707B|nr:calcium-independent phospholipase A2-gamma [Anoplophora glabripennis]
MTSLTKNISHCRRCVSVIPKRHMNTGSSNAIDATKMQTKNIVLSQWKLINELKSYISKFTADKTIETALNKEFAQLLQNINAKSYGSDLVRYFSSISVGISRNLEMTEINQDQGKISLPNILNELVNGKPEEKKEVIPKWKISKRLTSKETVLSQTNIIVSSLNLAEDAPVRLLKIEELIDHLRQHPEEKHNAVKDGAIRILLRIRKTTTDQIVLEAVNEAFALLGHTDPVPGSGIRILSIDGGGVRGILVIEMLRKLEELTGKPIYKMFDFICGVSTGAIIATLIGLRQNTLDETAEIYKNISTQIFSQSAIKGTSNLVWSHSYYDTALWEKLLKAQWDNRSLIETRRNLEVPKFCAVSAVVNQSRLAAYVFRNYALPYKVQSQYIGGHNHAVWETVRASAAAPTYFEEYRIGNMLHQDGGILVNNPTSVAIHEAKLLWPTTPIQCIVSFGTGRTAPNPIDASAELTTTAISNSSWKKKFLAILDSATDTEGVHTMLSDLLPPNVYYRFNPYLTDMLDMAEIDPNKLEQLKRDALMYLRRNEDKFQDAAKVLSMTKSRTQKLVDWFSLQKEIHGFKSNMGF